MHPPSPVSIPPDVEIMMESTEYLIFKFTKAGVFCCTDAKDFIPKLPHGQRFTVGDTWPDPVLFPKGAQPTGDKDSTYKYETGENTECDNSPVFTVNKVIHVGSSQS